ncbi:MAG: hypothetical protein ABIO06_10175 [Pseudolysinimonas sp.]
MILREFLYLDEPKLDQYLSQVEGGLRSGSSTAVRSGTSKGGKVDAKVVSAELGDTKGIEETTSRVDTGGSRFDRLISLVASHHDEIGWVEVVSNADIAQAGPRQILELDVELSGGSDLDMLKPGGMLSQFSALAGLAAALGAPEAEGMPSANQLEALAGLGKQMSGRLMRGIALADERTTVFGMLKEIDEPRPLEGDVRLVGKVLSLTPSGGWAMPPNMPMYSGLPRDQRREMARKGPANEAAEKLWIRGPAIELDVLAIWN